MLLPLLDAYFLDILRFPLFFLFFTYSLASKAVINCANNSTTQPQNQSSISASNNSIKYFFDLILSYLKPPIVMA